MSTLLASRIKNRRKELKMSQKELAEGICKQGQISRLENGEYIPGSVLLYELSRKLKVSMDYFFLMSKFQVKVTNSTISKVIKDFYYG